MEAEHAVKWRKHELALLLLVFGLGPLLCGCGPARYSTEALARQIAAADHVVVYEWYHGSRVVLSGREASNLVQVVASAEGIPKNVSAATAPCCELEFFQGTNLLAGIQVQEEWLGCETGEFMDKTGQLKALQRRVEADPEGRRAWTRHLVGEVMMEPGFTNLQPWTVEVLQHYATRQGGDTNDVEVPYKDYPPWFEQALRHNSRLWSPQFFVHKAPSGQSQYLELNWGHYAVWIGPTNFVSSVPEWYVTNAAPGIYGCHFGMME